MISLLYPDVPGSKGTDTSNAAAQASKAFAKELAAQCLAALQKGDLTADECAEQLGKTAFSVRPRFSELRERGQIFDTGIRRKNGSGHGAIVWTITNPNQATK